MITRSVHAVQRNSVRPPTKVSWMCMTSENSVQSLLQLLHGKRPHSLRGRLGFEDTRFLSEWIDALLCWGGRLLLQLQIQHPCKLEVIVLLDLRACNPEKRIHDAFHLFVLQTVGL